MLDKFEQIYWDLVNGLQPSLNIEEILNLILENSHSFTPSWHALGFIHCQLYKNDNGTLRLHIWPKNYRHKSEQKEKIHDHIFSLNSYVVCGEIKNLYYELVPHTSLNCVDKLQLYKVEYKENCSILAPTGKFFSPILSESNLIKSKEIYKIDRKVFHESNVDHSQLVCTLVSTYDFVKDDPHMLGVLTLEDQIVREKVKFPINEWKEIIQEVINELNLAHT